jgi:5-formyltetrahydrofolate cyclo-ligase
MVENAMNGPASKQELRAQAIARRRQQPDKDELSRQILARLVALPEYKNARTVMTYVSMPDEVRTEPLLKDAWAKGRRVVVPFCVGNVLQLFVLESLDELTPGTLGILEPRPELRSHADRVADPSELDLVVVPGVVFDRQGGRVGYGKGYYDGLLKRVRPATGVIALAFECQLVDRVPMLPHDVPMQKILTEQAIYEALPGA